MTISSQQIMALDERDLLMLKMLHDKSYSITELRDAIQVRSVATVHHRLMHLQDLGLIEQPKEKQARSRTITTLGIKALQIRRLL